MQGQLQHTKGGVVTDLRIRLVCGKGIQAGSPGTHDKLTDAFWISLCVRILRREPLIGMVVTIQYNVRSKIVERLPKCLRTGIVTMLAGTEARLVPVGQCAHALIGA